MGLSDLRVEETSGGSGDELTIDARTGESIEILARGVGSGGANAIVEESVREETMLNHQADSADDIEIFPRDAIEDTKADLLREMAMMGFNAPTIKVPEGHTYSLNPDDSASNATVLYREADAGRFTRTDPGGPDNPTRTFISLGEEDSALSSDGTAEEFEVTTSTNVSPLSGFPYTEDAPQGFEYELQAVMAASDDSDGANTPVIDAVRLETEETSFLRRSDGTIGQNLAQYPNIQDNVFPLVFEEPITIQPGQQLDLFVTKNASSGTDVQAATACVFYRRSVR